MNLAVPLAIICSFARVNANLWGPKPIGGRGNPRSFHRAGPSFDEKSKLQGALALSTRRGGSVEPEGKSTIAASVFNLVNNVAGAGLLTLSSAMASGSGWIPAILICCFLGVLSAHSFSTIGEACELTGEADFKVSATKISLCRTDQSMFSFATF